MDAELHLDPRGPVLLQVSSNGAQAAFQALIPDQIDPPRLGLAALVTLSSLLPLAQMPRGDACTGE